MTSTMPEAVEWGMSEATLGPANAREPIRPIKATRTMGCMSGTNLRRDKCSCAPKQFTFEMCHLQFEWDSLRSCLDNLSCKLGQGVPKVLERASTGVLCSFRLGKATSGRESGSGW